MCEEKGTVSIDLEHDKQLASILSVEELEEVNRQIKAQIAMAQGGKHGNV